MIAYLKGTLTQKKTERVIIEAYNVGYEVEISNQTFSELPKEGSKIKLLIYHHFTDSEQRLFGFYTQDEKKLFQLLITVKGVGPKLGLTILSGLPAAHIIESLVQQDKSALTQIKGIGKKTAERMILELKDKIENIAVSSAGSASVKSSSNNIKNEAVEALQSLGIKKSAAKQAVKKANSQNDANDIEALIKKALNMVNK